MQRKCAPARPASAAKPQAAKNNPLLAKIRWMPRGSRGGRSQSRCSAGRHRMRTRPLVTPMIEGDASQLGPLNTPPVPPPSAPPGHSEHSARTRPSCLSPGSEWLSINNPSGAITARTIPLDIQPPPALGNPLIATRHPNAASPANSAPWPSASLYSNSRLGQSTEPCGERVGVSSRVQCNPPLKPLWPLWPPQQPLSVLAPGSWARAGRLREAA